MSNNDKQAINPWPWLAALIALTAIVYLQVCRFEFVNFDDPTYVTQNPAVLKGLSLEGVRWAFTHGVSGHWHPLTILSHMFDVSVWGPTFSGGHHVTNLALHLINVLLLYHLVRRLLGTPVQSLIVAALFALHPIHVESVAWISIRKDVLSQFFGLLALIVYVDYVRAVRDVTATGLGRIGRYGLVVVLFALGLMSKAVLVTLPASMLLLDFWPLRRWEEMSPADLVGSPIGRVSTRRIGVCIIEKIPLFILSGIASWMTVRFMTAGHVLSDLNVLPVKLRIENGLISYIIYLRKLFFPMDLSVQYTYPEVIPVWQWGGALVLLLLITGLAISQVRRRPYLIMGWLWFLGTIFPVSGVMQAGMQPMADRYAYLSFIGLYLILACLGTELLARLKMRPEIVLLCAGSVGVVMVGLTYLQISYWQNTTTLFARAVAIDDGNYLAHNNLGTQYREMGDLDAAMDHFKRAHELNPLLTAAIENIALTYMQKGDNPNAIEWYQQARRADPKKAASPLNLGWLWVGENQFQNATECFSDAIRLDPQAADPHMGMAQALGALHQDGAAEAEFNRAIVLAPRYLNARFNFGVFLFERKRFAEAAEQFRIALSISPELKTAQEYLDRCVAGTTQPAK